VFAVALRDTATTMLAAADRAPGPAVRVRWLVRAFLDLAFLTDRRGQAAVAVAVADVARGGLAGQELFLATAVDGLVAAVADADRATARLLEAGSLYERLFAIGDPAADPLCAELYGETTLETGEWIATRQAVEGVLAGGAGGPADRHRLYALLGRVEQALARPVPAAAAYRAAQHLTAFVDDERLADVTRRLAALETDSHRAQPTGEELDVASPGRKDSAAAAAAEIGWSVRDVEFYKASAWAKVDRPGRHRRLRSVG
jgi:hypothetical protein